MAYCQAMAPFLRRLGPALVRGDVVILPHDYVERAVAAANDVGVIPPAGWLEQQVVEQLALLSKILNGTLTAEELGALRVALGDSPAATTALEIVHQLRGRETAAGHLRNGLQLLQPLLDDYRDHGDDPAQLRALEDFGAEIAAAAMRIHQALGELEPAREPEAPAVRPLQLVEEGANGVQTFGFVADDEPEAPGSSLDVGEEDEGRVNDELEGRVL
jgi:hypothetical protein